MDLPLERQPAAVGPEGHQGVVRLTPLVRSIHHSARPQRGAVAISLALQSIEKYLGK